MAWQRILNPHPIRRRTPIDDVFAPIPQFSKLPTVLGSTHVDSHAETELLDPGKPAFRHVEPVLATKRTTPPRLTPRPDTHYRFLRIRMISPVKGNLPVAPFEKITTPSTSTSKRPWPTSS